MDIERLLHDFLHGIDRFIRKVEAYVRGVDTAALLRVQKDVAELNRIALQSASGAARELEQIDGITGLITGVVVFVGHVDVANVAEKAGVSETSRMVLQALQRELLDLGSKLGSAYSARVNTILKTKSIPIHEVERILLARLSDTGRALGSVYSKMARRYVPLMAEDSARAVRAGIVEVSDRLLGASRTPIDATLPLSEQVLSRGGLIPRTISITIRGLYKRLNFAGNPGDGLAPLAESLRAHVVFIQRRAEQPIEYNSRSLFDSEYIAHQGLTIPKFSGLCNQALERAATVRPLIITDRARVGDAFTVHRVSGATRVLVLESLAPDMVRILAPPGSKEDTIEYDDARQYLDGPDDRASRYHALAEEEILSHRPPGIASIVEMYRSASATNAAAEFRSRVTARLTDYLGRCAGQPSLDEIEIYKFCVASVEMSEDMSPSFVAAMYLRITQISRKIYLAGQPYDHAILSGRMDRDWLAQTAQKIIQMVADENLFDFEESLYMLFERTRAKVI